MLVILKASSREAIVFEIPLLKHNYIICKTSSNLFKRIKGHEGKKHQYKYQLSNPEAEVQRFSKPSEMCTT